MRENTDEYIMYLIDKYRDFFIADLESSICLECYNMVKKTNLTENDVEFKDSVCKMCGKQKPCVVQNNVQQYMAPSDEGADNEVD